MEQKQLIVSFSGLLLIQWFLRELITQYRDERTGRFRNLDRPMEFYDEALEKVHLFTCLKQNVHEGSFDELVSVKNRIDGFNFQLKKLLVRIDRVRMHFYFGISDSDGSFTVEDINKRGHSESNKKTRLARYAHLYGQEFLKTDYFSKYKEALKALEVSV